MEKTETPKNRGGYTNFDPTPQDDLLSVLRDLNGTNGVWIETADNLELEYRLRRLRRDARRALERYDGSAE